MSQKDHVILNFIDSPLKILFWTKGEIVITLVPFITGLICDYTSIGIGMSLLNAYLIKLFKRKFGKGQLQAVMYWYLPLNSKLKALPPTHIIEYF